jgi:hypothetical protein
VPKSWAEELRMLWIVAYLAVASVVAPTVFVAGQWFATRSSDAAAEHPAMTAALAGAIWPILLVGLTELLLVSETAHRLVRRPGPNRLVR